MSEKDTFEPEVLERERETIDREARERGISREELLRRAAAAGIVVGFGGLAGKLDNAFAAPAASLPKRGGTFRIGVSGGSAKDLIDGQHIITRPDQARITTGWEGLVRFNDAYKVVQDSLATHVSAKRPDVWTIRLRKGVEFWNGKTMTADDVIYSFRREISQGLFGGAAIKASIDPNRIQKLDKYTLRLHLKRKDANLLDELAQYTCNIVPVGYNRWPAPQVGTGPYKLQSFSPGQRSVHVRNPNYWRHGEPYFDEVIIIDIPDDSARVNALLTGQVDAITDIPPAQVPIVSGHGGTHVLESPSANWTPICMRVDVAPFKDVRVRQAMRLIANRPQMVRQALSGHGHIGNDLYAPFDPDYDHALPQRHQDIARAKHLLKKAGHSGLTLDLQSTNGILGQNEGAHVFAQQARAAGVKINVKELDSGTFYGTNYLKWVFSTDFWGTRNYLSQVASGSLPTAPYNETHWASPAFIKLYREALSTVNDKKRREIEHAMQAMEWNSGGYIVWGFSTMLDGYSSRVHGLKKGDKGILPLNHFGHGYRTIWF